MSSPLPYIDFDELYSLLRQMIDQYGISHVESKNTLTAYADKNTNIEDAEDANTKNTNDLTKGLILRMNIRNQSEYAVMAHLCDEYMELEVFDELLNPFFLTYDYKKNHYDYGDKLIKKIIKMDQIVEFFQKIISDKGFEICVTNDTISIEIVTLHNRVVFQDFIANKCQNCDSYSRSRCVLYCKDCEINQNDDKKYMIDSFCKNCVDPNKNFKCSVEESHRIYVKKLDNIQKCVINCDMCRKQFDIRSRNQPTMSSLDHDLDICTDCSKTEKGKQIVTKYNMIENQIIVVRSHFGFGSIFDWVPFFKDSEKENYIALCVNKTNIHYKRVAIICKNNYNCYEYTIVLEEIYQISNKDLDDLNKLADKYNEYTYNQNNYHTNIGLHHGNYFYKDNNRHCLNTSRLMCDHVGDAVGINDHEYEFRFNTIFPPLTNENLKDQRIINTRYKVDVSQLIV